MPINFETVKTSLYNWAVSVVPSGMPVIFWQQNAPRPNVPYITLFLNTVIAINQDWTEETTDIDGNAKMKGDRQFTLSVQAYGGSDPLTVLENVRSSLQKQSVLDTLRANGIVFFQSLNISDITELFETEWEKRAILDVLLGIGQAYIDNLGYFDHAQIEETFLNANGDIVINKILDVPEI